MGKARTEKKKQKVAGYRILSVLFLLLAVGGLFIGLLGKIPALSRFGAFLSHAELYASDGKLGGSLIGLFIAQLGTLKTFFSLLFKKDTFAAALTAFNCSSYGQLAVKLAEIVFLAFCLLAAVFSLICFIAAMASRKSARGSAMFAGGFTVFSYGGLFLLNYAYNCSGTGFAKVMFDFPTAIVAGVALVLLVVTALLRNKGTGIIAILTTACVLGIFFALCYPGYPTAALIGKSVDGANRTIGLLDYMKVPGYTFCVVATLVLVCLVALNLFFSLCRFNAKKGFGFDVFRFLLLLLGAILLIVAFVAKPIDNNRAALFNGMGRIIPSVIIIVAAIVPFILYILRSKVKSKKKKKPSQTTAQAHVDTIKGRPTVEHSYRDDNEEEEIRRILAVEARNRTVYVPVYTPGSSINEEEEKPVEKTEFEKRMEAIARGEKLSEEPVEIAPAATEEIRRAMPASAPLRTPKTAPQTYNSEQYNEDPFMRTLSDDEKDEFAREFIANKHNVQAYLPEYVVGSYNEEFFMKVFVYLGRFHNYISESLLVKMSNYVSLLRSR